MITYKDKLIYSSQDIRDYLGCKFSISLNFMDRVKKLPRTQTSALDDLLRRRGIEFEEGYHDSLTQYCDAEGLRVIDISDGTIDERFERTIQAMQAGYDYIYQACLVNGDWLGYPDYLRKIPGTSQFGDYRYEIVDVKSRKTPSADNVMQISLYAYLINSIQSSVSEYMWLVTGSHEEHRFKYSDFAYYHQTVMNQFLEYVRPLGQQAAIEASVSEQVPCQFCDRCKWSDVCDAMWQQRDHVSLVSGIRGDQVRKLAKAGIDSIEDIAGYDGSVHGIGSDTMERMQVNARLVLEKRTKGAPQIDVVESEEGRGFSRLPQPCEGDLFLDLEGDPTHPNGRIEYLFGFWDGKSQDYVDFWAHNEQEEKQAFESCIDFITERLIEYPEAYIYHYGSYEETQIKRLAAQYATRESEVDEILRKRRLVDLLKVAREGVRTSESGSGLKVLEAFFLPEGRVADVQTAKDSVVLYAQWTETGDDALLNDIGNYNEEDCLSTMKCRDWLLSLCPDDIPRFQSEPFSEDKRTMSDSSLDLLIADLNSQITSGNQEFLELSAQLTMSHSREARPAWWDYFEKGEYSTDESVESADCIGDLQFVSMQSPARGNPVCTYKFSDQEYKFKERDRCVFTAINHEDVFPLDHCGQIISIDRDNLSLSIRHSKSFYNLDNNRPVNFSIAPESPIPTHMLRRAVERYVGSLIQGSDDYTAISGFLQKKRPVIQGHTDGAELLTSDDDIEGQIISLVSRMQGSAMFIQGPPGSGKTTLGGKLIVSLMRAGKKIGVTSNSHKAIIELLQSVENAAKNEGFSFSGQKKSDANRDETCINGTFIDDVFDNKQIDLSENDLIAGTAWLFCREAMDSELDYLFIDEAGQISLATFVAAGVSSSNIILLGDQMQLSQPSRGVHPGVSGYSTLEYLLEGSDTVATDVGIFLGTSYRMNPNICNFISAAFYEEKLKAAPNNGNKVLERSPLSKYKLPDSGVHFIKLDHEGRSQSSEEEALVIRDLVSDLLTYNYMDIQSKSHEMTLDDIVIVAPYNAQVNTIKEMLPDGARVGTIDLFQGQEAEVVIVSMTTSDRESLPRHFDFLFSRNRLNVALSRAKCLDIVIASGKLLSVGTRNIDEMGMVNTLCWTENYARLQHP